MLNKLGNHLIKNVDPGLLIGTIWSTIGFAVILLIVNLVKDFDDMVNNPLERCIGIGIWSVIWFGLSYTWAWYKLRRSQNRDQFS